MKIAMKTLSVLIGVAAMSMILAGCMGDSDVKPEKEDPGLKQLQESGAQPVPEGFDPGSEPPKKGGAAGK
jgi:PBP1b-binding outer membrane lipoprotein LpoB